MVRYAAIVLAGLVATQLAPFARTQAIKDSLPLPAADAVEFVSPTQITVPAGRTALVDLHFRIAGGLHINSHEPSDKFLVPTRLAVVEAPGLNVTAVDFPPGTAYTFPFAPGQKFSVYTGDFVLHAHLKAQPGEHSLDAGLHYQACDANSCMPAKTIPVSVTVTGK
jgi:hypothetical protein